jgi:zinc D-Ala-D-Ala carboxypeptidase
LRGAEKVNIDWAQYPNFSKKEFDCKHTGANQMQPEFMARLQRLRIAYGKPMAISSGYRSPQHPVELRKSSPGAHSAGRACDVVASGRDAFRLIQLAIEHGFTGVGVQQKGASRFIHLDDLEHSAQFSRPTVWSY